MTGATATESSRDQIIRAAAESLLESGYSGTSVRSIASKAGVAIGNLQYWFPTKSELLVEAWRYLTATSVQELRRTLNQLTDPLEVLVPLVLNTVLGFGLYYVVTRDDESCLLALSAFRQLAGSVIETVE